MNFKEKNIVLSVARKSVSLSLQKYKSVMITKSLSPWSYYNINIIIALLIVYLFTTPPVLSQHITRGHDSFIALWSETLKFEIPGR